MESRTPMTRHPARRRQRLFRGYHDVYKALDSLQFTSSMGIRIDQKYQKFKTGTKSLFTIHLRFEHHTLTVEITSNRHGLNITFKPDRKKEFTFQGQQHHETKKIALKQFIKKLSATHNS